MKKYAWVILLAAITIILMVLSLTNIINQSLGMCVALALVIVFDLVVARYAFKNDVKIIAYLMILLAGLGLVLFVFNVYGFKKMYKDENYKFQITLVKEESPKTFLFSYDGYDYYTYNTKNVNVILRSDEKTYTLKNALETNLITLDEILSLAIPNSNTIGYKIYYDGGQQKYDNDQYSIVVCENGKKDIIFSPFDYTYQDELCK